jgi:uncharacterized membrane protein
MTASLLIFFVFLYTGAGEDRDTVQGAATPSVSQSGVLSLSFNHLLFMHLLSLSFLLILLLLLFFAVLFCNKSHNAAASR